MLLEGAGLLKHLWEGDDWPRSRIALAQGVLAALPGKVSFELALAGLLYGCEPQRSDRICRLLTASNRTRSAVVWLLDRQAGLDELDQMSLADVKLLMQHEWFEELLMLFKASLRATHKPDTPYRRMRRRCARIDPASVAPAPFVDGHDLMALGLKPGPRFSRLLDRVYRAQLNEELKTRKQALVMIRCIVAAG
jgi:poly(A) polymerase